MRKTRIKNLKMLYIQVWDFVVKKIPEYFQYFVFDIYTYKINAMYNEKMYISIFNIYIYILKHTDISICMKKYIKNI